jgi:DNA modification methylase
MDQCIFYEGLLGNADPKIYQGEGYYSVNGEKEVIVFCEGSEKMGNQWPHLDYDLAFTSPPYFGTERYAEGVAEEEQSWHAYPTYESWINDYLFKTLDNIYNVLSETGAIAINIIDVKMQNKRYLVCDPMTKHMKSMGMPLQEVIGMRMKQRPKNVTGGDVEYMQECFIEPIWVYSSNKENIETPFQRLFT